MKKNTWLKVLAIGAAVAGAVIAVLSFLKRKSRKLSEELDFEDSMYFEDEEFLGDESYDEDLGEDELQDIDAFMNEAMAEEALENETDFEDKNTL